MSNFADAIEVLFLCLLKFWWLLQCLALFTLLTIPTVILLFASLLLPLALSLLILSPPALSPPILFFYRLNIQI